jgi:hypothetical protein
MKQIIKNNLGYIRADIKNIIKHSKDTTICKELENVLWKLSEEYLESADGLEKKILYDRYKTQETEKILKEADDVCDLNDDKIHPSHYQSYYKDGVDCLTAMEHAWGKTCVAHFAIGNALKYLWRHSSKGKMQDIDKAIEYLNIYKKLNIIDLGV